jgi:lipoprotein-releasing system permease protein
MNNPSLVSRIAFRYLRGKGSVNAVPVLSRISMAAIAVSSAAMIILFSVFNGFESLIDELYQSFYPDLTVTKVNGKFFDPRGHLTEVLRNAPEIACISAVIEDNVLVNTEAGETIPIVLKGVDAAYFQVNHLKPAIVKGVDTLSENALTTTAILGQYVAANLGVDVDNVFSRISVFYPNPTAGPASMGTPGAFQTAVLKPDGAFAVQEELDSKYIIAPLATVQKLLLQSGHFSGLELKIKEGVDVEVARRRLQQALGPDFKISTRYELNRAVYMVLQSEKWAGYAILLFVLLIASFNMISALSLLVLEKQKDMSILMAMGILPGSLRNIVFLEGLLWALVGGGIGLSVGTALCFAQTHFQLVKIEGNFIIDAYPVALKITDVLTVLITVSLVGLLAAVYPARRAARQELKGGFAVK